MVDFDQFYQTLDPYKSARSKLTWARKLISELEHLINKITPESCTISITQNPKTKEYFVRLNSNPLGQEYTHIFGDAIVNIRSALDHCYATAIGANNTTSGQVNFPIRDNRQALIGALKRNTTRHSMPNFLHDFILDEVKPYMGGNDPIVALNKLSNKTKHIDLILILGATSVNVSMIHGTIIKLNCTYGVTAGGQINISRGSGPIQFLNEPQVTIDVRIGEREPKYFHEKLLVPSLIELTNLVESIVNSIDILTTTFSTQSNCSSPIVTAIPSKIA